MSRFHIVVIGGGPGGYVAAIRAAQLGFRVAVVEKENLGGICLNWGCIPTKALLDSAHHLEDMRHASTFGIKAEAVAPDFPVIIHRSRKVADDMSHGVDYLMKKNEVEVIKGTARFLDRNMIRVEQKDGVREVESERFIIATGARAKSIPGIKFDGKHIIGYREAMVQEKIPESLCVIGAGAIGMEFTDFYASMGSSVTVLEAQSQVLPLEDKEIADHLKKLYLKRNIDIQTNASIESAEVRNDKVHINYKTEEGTGEEKEFDLLLMATGIQANTDGLNLEKLKIRMENDRIIVDERYRTSAENIYAIGDCIPGPALAHVASMEGIRCIEGIKAQSAKSAIKFEAVPYHAIPSCTYCSPEVASIGLTEKQAREKGYEVKVGRFPFTASGRARASGHPEGFVKIIADKKYGKVLGAHMIGSHVTELIGKITTAITSELLIEDLARTTHAHPTLSEVIMEAAADALGEAIHI